VKDDESYSEASEAEQKQVERMRVGVRNGMMPWGRERLAESAYEKAVAELKKPTPDRKKALWHLDCATNLNPKFTEAIALKAQLTGEEVTAVDNSTIKSFVQRVVLADRRRPATTMPADDTVTAPEPNGTVAPSPKAVESPTTKPANLTTASVISPKSEPGAGTESPEVVVEETTVAEVDAPTEEQPSFEDATLVEIDAAPVHEE
jgi:hypothetical protein